LHERKRERERRYIQQTGGAKKEKMHERERERDRRREGGREEGKGWGGG